MALQPIRKVLHTQLCPRDKFLFHCSRSKGHLTLSCTEVTTVDSFASTCTLTPSGKKLYIQTDDGEKIPINHRSTKLDIMDQKPCFNYNSYYYFD